MMDTEFCILPWVSLYIRADGNIYPCESVAWNGDDYLLGNMEDCSLEQAWNHRVMCELRKKILQLGTCELSNVQKNSCMYLINHSLYAEAYKNITKTHPDGAAEFTLQALFLERSNMCNLKCIYCCATSSSIWEKESDVRIKKIPDEDYDIKLLPYLSKLKEIFLSGGEPVINPYNYKILTFLQEHNPNIQIGIATNLTYDISKYSKFFTALSKFTNTRVFCSIDDEGDRFENIRVNSKWSLVKKNLYALKQYNIKIYFNSVISILNAFYFKEFHKHLIHDSILDIDSIRYITLVGPESLCIQALSDNKKDELKSYLLQYYAFLRGKEKNKLNIDTYPNYKKPSDAIKQVIEFLYARAGSEAYLQNITKYVPECILETTFTKLF
jgi:radical SAM protein with 4Fe4S-binding SPASM domain